MMNKETEYENFLKWLIKQQYYINNRIYKTI